MLVNGTEILTACIIYVGAITEVLPSVFENHFFSCLVALGTGAPGNFYIR